MHKAFVLSLFDTGVGAIRSLGRAGIPVIGLDTDPQMPGFRSRYCEARQCPHPIYAPEALLTFLIAEGKRLDAPGVLFPASDAFALFLSRYRQELEAYYYFILPEANVMEAIIDKRRQYEMAARTGTPYPTTLYPQTMEEVRQIKDQLQYPAFIKPCVGHLWREKFGGTHKGFKVQNPAELLARYEEIFLTGLPALVQPVILGPNTNHFKVCAYINQQGQPLAVFTLRKLRQYPTEFGVGTLVESLHFPELAELGLNFFRGIDYRGIGSIEFKRDERDGQLKMIELNPRLWQQNIQATACGMNFPLIQYLDLTGNHPHAQMNFREGVCWLDAMADFQSFWDYHRQGKLSSWEWIRSWARARSFATFASDDLGPFLKANRCGAKYLRLPLYLVRHFS